MKQRKGTLAAIGLTTLLATFFFSVERNSRRKKAHLELHEDMNAWEGEGGNPPITKMGHVLYVKPHA